MFQQVTISIFHSKLFQKNGTNLQDNKNYPMGDDSLSSFWVYWTKRLQFKNHIL